ncbi:MAG: D-glycero-beta-D-manno-heptose 1-phosphate adenylyltransferase [Ignavibacteriaceae bacterium]
MMESLAELRSICKRLKSEGKKIVFTNGCFDLIHAGHIDYLSKAKAMGDVLIVGLNTDDSVRRLKGKIRPILNEHERLFILSNIKPVDYVILFHEDTPQKLIAELLPDVLVKGEDWDIDEIVGANVVLANGGEVKNIKFVNDQSTSKIIKKIVVGYKDN